MNLPSPFAASAEEHFTVREISMLLPPQFVRTDAVAGSADQPVYLPADALRTSLQQGRPALRLSQIYLACPFLFNRPVQPSEDFEIALPFQKVKRIVEPGTPGAAGSPALGNPFAAVAGPPAQVTVPPKRESTPVAASPFLPAGEKIPSAQPSPSSPFPARTPGPQAPAAESPFGQRSAPQGGGNEVLSPFSSPPPAAERPPLPAVPANPFQRLDPPPSQLPLPPQPQQPQPATTPARAATSPFSLVAPGIPAAPAAPDTAPASVPKTTPMMFAPAAPAGEASASPFAQKTPTGNSPPAQHLPAEPPAAPAPAPATTPAPAPAPVSQSDPLPVAPLKKTEPQPVMPYSPPPTAPQTPPHSQTQSVEAPRQVTGQVAPAHRMLRVSLSSLLRDVTAEDLGFDPSAVPPTVEVEISYDTILPQLATGRVEVGLEELRQGVVERFRPAFGRVRADLRFVVPLSEIFQNLPSSAIPAPQPAEAQHIPISTTPFQTPFAIKADEDKERLELPDLPRATTAAVPLTSSTQASHTSNSASVAPFPVPVPAGPPVNLPPVNLPSRPPVSLGAGAPPPASDPQLPKLPGLPNLPKMPGMQGRPSPFSRPPGTPAPEPPQAPSLPQPPQAPVPHVPTPSGIPSLSAGEAHDDLGLPFSAASLRAEPPPPLKSPEPFDPSKLFNHDHQHAPKPVPAAPVPAPASPALPALWKAAPPRAAAAAPAAPPAMEFNFGDTGNVSKSTLRALFMTDADLSTEEVVEQCGGLPGLRACLVITSGGVVSSGINSSCDEVTSFTSQAPRAHEYLAGLAQSMGMEGAGSFTLRSAATVRTFFIERGLCLAVLHGQDRFEPGVRDKLMLTARTLADLLL